MLWRSLLHPRLHGSTHNHWGLVSQLLIDSCDAGLLAVAPESSQPLFHGGCTSVSVLSHQQYLQHRHHYSTDGRPPAQQGQQSRQRQQAGWRPAGSDGSAPRHGQQGSAQPSSSIQRQHGATQQSQQLSSTQRAGGGQ
eukprot:scaffold30986_cov19-Tisochrysis_lutea.AAC.1